MDLRQIKGLEIAKQKQVTKTENGFSVKSQSGNGIYTVNEEFECNCPDCAGKHNTCKHAYAARYYLQREQETPQGVKSQRVRLTYPQAWRAYTRAQNEEVNAFDSLLHDLVQEIDEPTQTRGRPRLSLKETVFCSIQKVYSQLSSRRAYSLYQNATERGQIERTPNYNAVNKLLNHAELTPILKELLALSAKPLQVVETDFAVDSSGFRTAQFGAYANAKYGLQLNHKWLKAHACVGVKTNVVTALEITNEFGADTSQFSTLVKATANGGFKIEEVSADKAYSSRENVETVAECGGQAYIPFKKSATGCAGRSIAWKKLYYYFQMNSEEFYAHYHKRSNVESTFRMIKAKFGETLKSKNHEAQVNELLCKIIAHNIVVVIHEMRELGISPDFSNGANKKGECV